MAEYGECLSTKNLNLHVWLYRDFLEPKAKFYQEEMSKTKEIRPHIKGRVVEPPHLDPPLNTNTSHVCC